MIRDFAEIALETLQQCGVDWAELFYEENYYSNLLTKNGEVAKSQMGVERGLGIRIWHEGREQYLSTNLLTPADLTALLKNLKSELKGGGSLQPPQLSSGRLAAYQNPEDEFVIERAKEIFDCCLPEIKARCGLESLNGEFNESLQRVEIYNSTSKPVFDERLDQSLMILGVKRVDERVFAINRPLGKIADFSTGELGPVQRVMAEIEQDAQDFAAAKPFTSGNYPVVVDKGQGVFIHEIIGHALEADNIMNNASIFCGRLGQKVASEDVTIIDESLVGQKGYYHIDDEGVSAQKTVLVENGWLKGYLTDRQTAKALNLPLTGNGRRESYLYPPLPRMSCTYLQSGAVEAEALVHGVKEGFFVKKLLGGEVNISTGDFYLNAPRIYKIRAGRICEPVASAILSGNALEILANIQGVASDLTLDQTGKGLCYKQQSVPVSFGQPTVLIHGFTVRGERG